MYAGNGQAGPVYEVEDPNDAVIDRSYKDYHVPSAILLMRQAIHLDVPKKTCASDRTSLPGH